jgi:hypothetical protein
LAVLLFMLFVVALTSAYVRGLKIACACFGGNNELETVGLHSLVRTALLLVLAVVAVFPVDNVMPLEVIGLALIFGALTAIISELTRLLGPLRQTTVSILEEVTSMGAEEPEVTQ